MFHKPFLTVAFSSTSILSLEPYRDVQLTFIFADLRNY